MVIYKRYFYLLTLVFTVFITMFLLVGCTVNKESGNSENSIEYASAWEYGEPQAEFLRQVANNFEEETGTKVELLFYGRDVIAKIKARLLMGDPPDIIEQGFHPLSVFISQGLIKPIDLKDMFYNEKGPEGQSRLIDIFDEKSIKLFEKDGKLNMFPYEYFTSGFFYDKNLFDKYDLNVPTTWDEFIENNEVFQRNDISPLALDANAYSTYYYSLVVDRILGPGALRTALEDTSGSTWDNPGYFKTAELVYGLGQGEQKFFQKGYEKTLWPSAQIGWAEGKYGNILCYTWLPSEIQGYSRDGFEFGFYPFPEIEGGKSGFSDVEANYFGCVIPENSKNISFTKTFLRFLIKEENAKKFVKITNNISARKDVEYPSVLASVQDYVKNAKNVYLAEEGYCSDYPEWWINVFSPLNEKLTIGELDPKSFIKQIKEESIRVFTKK